MTLSTFDRRQPNDSFDFDGVYGSEYAQFASRVIPAYEQTFDLGYAHMMDRLGPTARVLVVGCGAGADLATFGKHAPEWTLDGVDPSPQMIALARARVREEGLEDRCTFHEGFVSDLPAEPVFDGATLYNVMHFMADDGAKLALLTSIAERLRPGGVMSMIDVHGDPHHPFHQTTLRAWRRYIEMHLSQLPASRIDEFFRQIDTGIHWVPESRVLELLTEAGFETADRFFHALFYGGWVAGIGR